MLRITSLMFNGSIWLGISGAIHLFAHAFMACTGTTLHDRILLILVVRYVAGFGFVFNGSIWLGMSGAIHLLSLYGFLAWKGKTSPFTYSIVTVYIHFAIKSMK